MNLWTDASLRRACWGAVGAGMAAAALAVDPSPIEQLRAPIENYPDGRIKTQVSAGSARILAEGTVDAADLRVEMYGTNGTVEGWMEAKQCLFNREAGSGKSDGDVTLQARGATVTGTGFEWNAKDRTVRILKNAKVVLEKCMKLPLPRGKTASGEAKGDGEPNS